MKVQFSACGNSCGFGRNQIMLTAATQRNYYQTRLCETYSQPPPIAFPKFTPPCRARASAAGPLRRRVESSTTLPCPALSLSRYSYLGTSRGAYCKVFRRRQGFCTGGRGRDSDWKVLRDARTTKLLHLSAISRLSGTERLNDLRVRVLPTRETCQQHFPARLSEPMMEVRKSHLAKC